MILQLLHHILNLFTLSRRYHLWEWHDLPWVSNVLRSMLVTSLQYFWCSFPNEANCSATALLPMLRRVTLQCGTNDILDMCSGNGGPYPVLAKEFQRLGMSVVLSDLYPQDSWKEVSLKVPGGALKYISAPVDAMNLSKSQSAGGSYRLDFAAGSHIRTFMCCFHHFTPEQGVQLIQDAIRWRHGIVIVEATPRSWPILISAVLLHLFALFTCSLFMAPFGSKQWFQRVALTFLVPVFPLMYVWDCAVSHLRCYTVEELKSMAAGCTGSSEYRWEVQVIHPLPFMPLVKLVAFVGVPILKSLKD